MKIKLHYAKLDLGGQDIPVYTFTDWEVMADWVESTLSESNEQRVKVFLVSYEETNRDHVFVSEYPCAITEFTARFGENYPDNIFIQEYESYEAAYGVALDMKSGVSSLTYDPDKDVNSVKTYSAPQ